MVRIDNVTVSSTAPVGAAVGTLALLDSSNNVKAANFICTEDSAGFFWVAGGKLVTVKTPIPAGYYSVQIQAVGTTVSLSGDANFTITVT
jgi:hypothetical protein